MSEQRYYARVRVTFEMTVDSGPWGGDTTAEQMHRDVLRAASNAGARVVDIAARATPGVGLHYLGADNPTIVLEKPRG